MRPIDKPAVGNTITYLTSDGSYSVEPISGTYSPFSQAKLPLIGAIGHFCSYCEIEDVPGSLAVEHIAAKSRGGALVQWDNFLLSCNVCNSNKGVQLVNLQDSHWPHVNNTYLSFVYDSSGRVHVNPNLSGVSKTRAERLYDICKLGRYPGVGLDPSPSDFRWYKRFETWSFAVRDLKLYKDRIFNVDDVIKDAFALGFWSVWFTVFRGEDEVRSALIHDFPGTDVSSFDPGNHFEPVNRNPDNLADPV